MLTKKELTYIKMLICRNANNILYETERLKVWTLSLERPMSAVERKRRERIRRKALKMAWDLVLVYYAGILPRQKFHPKTPKTAKELVEKIEAYMRVLMQEHRENFYQWLEKLFMILELL